MTNVNGFSGGMTLSAGTVEIGNASALGTGTVTMTGGKLSSSSTTGYSLANALWLNGTMTLGDATNNGALTFSGTTTIAETTALTTASTVTITGQLSGSGALTKTGTADLFLTGGSQGQNTGTFTHSAGTLYIGASASGYPNQIEGPANQNPAVVFNADAYIRGSLTYNWYNITSGSGGVYIRNNSSNGVVLVNSWSGYTGSLRLYADSAEGTTVTQRVAITNGTNWTNNNVFFYLSGNGLTSLTQTLAWTGSGNLTSGNLLAIQPGSGSMTAVLANESSNAGTLTSTSEIQHTSTTNATFQIAASNGPIVVSNVIRHNASGGVLSVTKTGTNAATLSGANTFTGAVSVSAGTLNANSATALGAASSTAAISVTSGATLSLGAALSYSSRTTSISGVGVTGVAAGCLVLANAGPLSLGAINATNNTYIRGTTTTQLTSAIAWSGSGGLRLGAATGTTATFSGAISVSSGTLTAILFGRSNNPDLGTVVLGTTNTFTAPAQIDFGTLRISADGNLGTAPGIVTSAYLIIGGNTTLATTATFTLNQNRGIALGPSSGSGTGTIDVASATTLTYAGIIANNSAGTGGLVKAGTGTLILTGNSNYTAGTDIAAGTLLIQGSGGASPTASPGTGTVTLNTAATGNSNTSLLLSGTGGADLWLYRNITVANQGTGTTTIGASAPTGGAYFVQTITLNKDVTVDTSSLGLVYLDGRNSANSLILTGTGNVTITGTGTAYLTGSTSYVGSTTVNSGAFLELQRNTDNQLPSGYDWTVNGTVRFNYNGIKTQTVGALNGSGVISTSGLTYPTLVVGSGNANGTFVGTLSGEVYLNKTGTGALTLSGSNTHAGTQLSAGTLTVASNGALGSGGFTINAGTLAASGLRTISNAITVAGDCAFDVNAAGAFIFQQTGAVTVSGARTVTVTGPSTGTQAVYWSGTVTTSGATFTKAGTGCLSFSGTTDLAAANVTAGRLLFNNAAADVNTPSVDVSALATLIIGDGLSDSTLTVGALTGAGSVSPEWGTSTATRTLSAQSGNFTGTIIDGAAGKNIALTKVSSGTLKLTGANTYSGGSDLGAGTTQAGNTQALGTTGTVTLTASGATLQTLTTGGQNGKLTVAALNNAAGGTIKIGG